MKKPNSNAEFEAHRRKFLIQNFRRAIAAQSQIAVEQTFRQIADAPAPRFWVSEPRAAAVIGKMLHGEDPTPLMYKEKREMYREIFRRFRALRPSRPGVSIAEIIFDIVNSPAPRSYISWHRVRNIIASEKKTPHNRQSINA